MTLITANAIKPEIMDTLTSLSEVPWSEASVSLTITIDSNAAVKTACVMKVMLGPDDIRLRMMREGTKRSGPSIAHKVMIPSSANATRWTKATLPPSLIIVNFLDCVQKKSPSLSVGEYSVSIVNAEAMVRAVSHP